MATEPQSSAHLARRRILSTIIHTLDDQSAYAADHHAQSHEQWRCHPTRSISSSSSWDPLRQSQQQPSAVFVTLHPSEAPPSIDRTIRSDRLCGDESARQWSTDRKATAANPPPSANRNAAAVASSASSSPVVKNLFQPCAAADSDQTRALHISQDSALGATKRDNSREKLVAGDEYREHQSALWSTSLPHTCSTAVQTGSSLIMHTLPLGDNHEDVVRECSTCDPDVVAARLSEAQDRRARRVRLHCFLRWHAKWFELQLTAARQRLAQELQTNAAPTAVAGTSPVRAVQFSGELNAAAGRGSAGAQTPLPSSDRPHRAAKCKARVASQAAPPRRIVGEITSPDGSSDEDDEKDSLRGLLNRLSIDTQRRVRRAMRQCELPLVPRVVGPRQSQSGRQSCVPKQVSDDSLVMRLSRISANVDKSFLGQELVHDTSTERRAVQLGVAAGSKSHGDRRREGEDLTVAERKLRALVKKLLWRDLPKWKRAERWEAYREASQTAIEALNALAHLSQIACGRPI